MSIVAEQFEVVIGVDTHAATHTLAVVRAQTGAQVGDVAQFPSTPGGLARAVAWIRRHCDGHLGLVVIEGIGSYGALLAQAVTAAAITVVEAGVVGAEQRRGRGKDDALDAARIARSVLGTAVQQLRRPRADGPRQALRVLVVAREQMSSERTRTVNALTALVRTIDLGIDARKSLSRRQITIIAGWRSRDEEPSTAVCRAEAVRLAKRIQALDGELADNRVALSAATTEQGPELLKLRGVGPVVAATILLAWSHPGRVRSEAAFASLAGTCPIPASSGNTTRHRLNRGGDRRLNRALTTAVIVRMRTDPTTRAYVRRRRAEGRTTKEIIRSIKRYLSRQVFRTLTAAHPRQALDAI
jgi:transposase